MPSIIVDHQRCTKDHLCLQICPVGILGTGTDGFPTSERPDRCVGCGHCMAVCPSDALALEGTPRTELAPIRPELKVAPEAVEQLLRARRSVRRYRKEPVPRELLERLIDTARMAPSGLNRQPIAWTIVSGPERLRRLSQLIIDWMDHTIKNDPGTAQFLDLATIVRDWPKRDPLRGAPHLVIARGNKQDPLTAGSGPLSMTYLELAAAAHGLGTCWAGYFQMAAHGFAPLLSAVELPESEMVAGAMMVGYPAIECRAIPARRKATILWQQG